MVAHHGLFLLGFQLKVVLPAVYPFLALRKDGPIIIK